MNLLTDEIYIYSKIVHRIQTWSNAGWISLPKQANLDTLMILGDEIQSQVIKPGYLYPEQDEVVIHKKGLTYNGIILSKQGDEITLIVDDNIVTISNYDSIEGKRPQNLEPGIIVYNHTGPIVVSYLMTGLNWYPNYNIIIDSDNTTILLMEVICSINNTTNTRFENVDVSVVAGDLNIPVMNIQSRALMAQSAVVEPSISSNYEVQPLDEYIKFNLGQLDLDVFTRVPLEQYFNIPTNKIYWNILGSEEVTFGYRFNAPNFLPQGKAYVYLGKQDQKFVDSFIGYSEIKETQPYEIVDLTIGRTSHVKIETEIQQNEIIQSEQKKGHIYQVSISSQIKSNLDHSINLILKFNIGDAKIQSITCPYIRKRGYLEFHIQPYQNQEDIQTTFECKLEYSI